MRKSVPVSLELGVCDRKAGTQVTELPSLSRAPGKSRPCTSLVRAASTQIDCLIRGRLQKGEQGFVVPALIAQQARLTGQMGAERGSWGQEPASCKVLLDRRQKQFLKN